MYMTDITCVLNVKYSMYVFYRHITLYYTTFMHTYVAHAYIQVNTVHKLLYLKNEIVLELTVHWKF